MRKYLPTGLLILLYFVFLAAAACFDWNSINFYEINNTSTLQYVRAEVLEVEEENLEEDPLDSSRVLGNQVLRVKILGGTASGEEVVITNYLTYTQNVYLKEGEKAIVCADLPENAQPYYTIYNYDRSAAVPAIIGVFAMVMILVGREKGVRAFLGLVLTVFTILLLLVQAIYHGFNPVGAAILTALLVTLVSLLLLNGRNRKTAAALLGTFAGVLITCIVFWIFARILHISGYNSDSADTLLLIRRSTGLSVRYILMACVLITALGAVMDVAMSLASALQELKEANPDLEGADLLRSGMNIGRDMIGTMSNTLILTYTGSGMITMLMLIGYGYQTWQLLSSDYLAIELAEGLSGTIGVILTVPVSSAICSVLYIKEKDFN